MIKTLIIIKLMCPMPQVVVDNTNAVRNLKGSVSFCTKQHKECVEWVHITEDKQIIIQCSKKKVIEQEIRKYEDK